MASPAGITGYIASWLILGLSLISKLLVASIAIYMITAASDWPRLFAPRVFLFSINTEMLEQSSEDITFNV